MEEEEECNYYIAEFLAILYKLSNSPCSKIAYGRELLI